MKIVFTIYYRIKAYGFQLKYHPKNYKITSLYLKKFFSQNFQKYEPFLNREQSLYYEITILRRK